MRCLLFPLLFITIPTTPVFAKQLKLRVVDSQEAVIVGAGVEIRGKQ
jgi:hypothetical protein